MSDMPKLLFVGIVERACRATVIREIPGIADCFQTEGDGSEPEIKVYYHYSSATPPSVLMMTLLADNKWI